MPEFVQRSRIPVPADAVRAWHLRPGALERLIPPWSGVRVLAHQGDLARGGTVELSVPVGPLRLRWLARHGAGDDPVLFIDEQERGPFSRWRHEHRVEPDGPDACWLEDRIDFALPLGAPALLVEDELRRQFAWRHRRTAEDLSRRVERPLHLAIGGASGLVGTALTHALTTGGHRVTALPRTALGPGQTAYAAADAAVILNGCGIADRRWSPERKREILRSRVDAVTAAASALVADPAGRCRTLICASGTGFYGDRGEEALGEGDPAGQGFLAEVCQAWERAADPARAAGIRVVHLRIGMVVSALGGGLPKMLTPFRLGLGGPIAGGRMWLPWIALDDLVHLVQAVAADPAYAGPVNAVAPGIVRQGAFAGTLGRVLGRPACAPMPAFAVDLAFGELGRELLLPSTRAEPRAARANGYRFALPELEDALRWELGR